MVSIIPGLLWRNFTQLSAEQLHGILKLRSDVFVVEQNCAYPEIDGRDPDAAHLLAGWQAPQTLAGYLRIFPPNMEQDAAIIGRVVVRADHRGKGLARSLIEEAITKIIQRHGLVPIQLSAQSRLTEFYGKLGFITASDEYLDDGGIPHIRMRRSV